MTQFKGRGTIQITGRRTGKSILAGHAFQRLWQDLHRRPVEELVLSEGKVYGARYYCVEPVGGSWFDMEVWCTQTFDSPGSVWDATEVPVVNHRWYMNDRKFWFRNAKDRDWFILKWSS